MCHKFSHSALVLLSKVLLSLFSNAPFLLPLNTSACSVRFGIRVCYIHKDWNLPATPLAFGVCNFQCFVDGVCALPLCNHSRFGIQGLQVGIAILVTVVVLGFRNLREASKLPAVSRILCSPRISPLVPKYFPDLKSLPGRCRLGY